jgi:hypothetical protein
VAAVNAANGHLLRKPRLTLFAGGTMVRTAALARKADEQHAAVKAAANDASAHAATAQEAADEAGKHAEKVRALPMRDLMSDLDKLEHQAKQAEVCQEEAKVAADQAVSCQKLSAKAANAAEDAAKLAGEGVDTLVRRSRLLKLLLLVVAVLTAAIIAASAQSWQPEIARSATLTQPKLTKYPVGTPIPIEGEVIGMDIARVEVLTGNRTVVATLTAPTSPGRFVVATAWTPATSDAGHNAVKIQGLNAEGIAIVAASSDVFEIVTPQSTPTAKP